MEPTAQASSPIPRLRGTPLVGHLVEFQRRRLELQERVARECGALGELRLGPIPVFAVSSAELAHAVLVENADAFIKSRGLQLARPLLGNGLLTSEHETHRRQRKLLAPGFTHRRVAAFATAMAEWSERVQAGWADGATLDLGREMMRLTLAIVGQTLFGANLVDQADGVGAALTLVNRYASDTLTRPWRLPLTWPTPYNRRVRQAVGRIEATIARLVEARRAAGVDLGDLLSLLVFARDEAGEGLDDTEIRDEAITLFLAGHETTANALGWAFYLLARHPELRARLEAEAATLGGRTPTWDDLPKLPFAGLVFKEAMRLYPPAYLVGRIAEREVRLGAHTLPKGSVVVVNVFAMHRRADYFAAPERFDPDRFSPEREAAIPRGAYMPFGAGPRICIGNHFALLEGQMVLATLAQRVRLDLLPDAKVEPETLITLRPRGLRTRVTRLRPA